MEFFLQAEDSLEIVLGMEEVPEKNTESYAHYRKRQGKAAAMINAACHSSVKGFIKGKRNPKEMWDALTDTLDRVNTRSGRLMIKREFNTLRPKQSITEYVHKLLECRTELQNSEQEISDEEFITHILTTLPSAFDSIVSIITHDKSAEAKTVDYVISTVLEADRAMESRKEEVGASTNTSGTLTTSNALITTTRPNRSLNYRMRNRQHQNSKSHRSNQRSSYSQTRSGSENVTCFYCTKRGHRIATCNLKRNAEKLRQNFQKEQHHSRDEPSADGHNASVATVVQALISYTESNLNRSAWVLDSSASDHFTNQKSAFIPGTLRRLAVQTEIQLGNSARVPTSLKGRIALTVQGFSLEIEALFAPQLRFSLLSINKLAQHCHISFDNLGCVITKHSSKGLGSSLHLQERNGLYSFHLSKPISSKAISNCRQSHHVIAATTRSATSSKSATQKAEELLELWHLRLGHLNKADVLKMLNLPSSLMRNNLEVGFCKVCIESKQEQSPPSHSGKHYFIVYIDDYSRTAFTYFLHTKTATEIVSVFQEFLARVEAMLPTVKFSRFRCDNTRGEYDNSLMRGILRVSGISFEPSPPYSQHKNGVSERMIRTLATKARSMLLDSQLELEFWAEAVSTAAYLHARSPSQTLNGMTPFAMLWQKKPVLDHLRRFGCAAYRLIPKEQRTGKFSSKSRECIMIGYVHSSTTIWKLWDRSHKSLVHSSDVIFHESTVLGAQVPNDHETDKRSEIFSSCFPDDLVSDASHILNDSDGDVAYELVPVPVEEHLERALPIISSSPKESLVVAPVPAKTRSLSPAATKRKNLRRSLRNRIAPPTV